MSCARLAAQQMLAIGLEAERRAYLDAHVHLLDDRGHRLVVGSGHQPARTIVTGAGTVEVRKLIDGHLQERPDTRTEEVSTAA